MADVKSMLNKFEQKDNMSAGRGNKPSVAAKPVLQRFQQPAKEDASSSLSNPVLKAGHPPVVKLAGFPGGFPALKPTTTNNNAGDKAGGRRVSVPKAFQNGHDASNNDDNNNNNNNHTDDQNTAKKDSWQRPKSPTFPSPPPSSSSSSSDHRPPTVPKFPSMSISNQSLTNKQDSDNTVDSSNSKKPLLPKHFQTKNDSIRSTSSTSSSASSSSSSSYKTANFSSPTSPTPKSPLPSSQSPTTAGSFDFKSMLRKVDASSSGPPVKRFISEVSNDEPDAPTPKTAVSTSSSNASATSAASSSSNKVEKPKTPSRVPPIPSTDDVSMRHSKPDESTEDIIVRKSDGKRFRKMPIPTPKPPSTPKKPPVPSNIDLTSIRQQYQRLKTGSDVSNDVPATEDNDDDDLYWDGETTNERTGLPPPPPPQKPAASVDRSSRRISIIPDMTEEEEFDLPVYDDAPIEEDVYDDGMSERPGDSKPKMSISSESQLSPTETEQEKKKRLKEEANAKKKEEKERREKEKKEREEEKKRKKKEEEEMKLRKKFNLTGREKMVGEGVIKQDAKLSGLNLKVTKGQIVTIVRLDSNPPNKWLVKIDLQLGYVDSQNIEVDPNIIRKAMTSQSEEDDDQPTYDDVPEEIGSSPIVPVPEDEDDGEEIYEFCE